MSTDHQIDFMKQMIALDFNVRLVGEGGHWILFAGDRKDLLHLVIYIPDSQSISQYHIPYYSLIEPLSEIKTMIRGRNSVVSEHKYKNAWNIQEQISLLSCEGQPIKLVINAVEIELPALALSRRLDRLDTNLRKAKRSIISTQTGYEYPNTITPGQKTIVAESERLVQAIAFEKLTCGELDVERFGLYSAYCSHVDFDRTTKQKAIMKDYAERAAGEFETVSSDRSLAQIIDTLQSRFLTGAMSHLEWSNDNELFLKSIPDLLPQLDDVQITQVMLMTGMHNAHLMHALAAATGILTVDQYCDIICEPFQPDSIEEQAVRASARFIELFGRLRGLSSEGTSV